MPNQFGWGLGMQGVSAFPSNFSNIGPSEQKAGSTRFTSKVPATMGVGGINSAYPSSLGLSGGAFGSGEMGSRDFGSLGLTQAQAFGFGQPASFTGGGEFRGEGYSFRQPLNSMALAPQTSIPIEGGALSVGINRAQTAGQMGRTAIQTPRGTIFATDQQQANMAAPRSIDQQSSRSPQQQQALLDNIRKNAPALNQQRTDWVQNTIQQRRENPTTYTTPSGMSVAVPTNRFGEPLKAWTDQLGGEGRLKTGPRSAPQTASAALPQQTIRGERFENLNSFNPSEGFTGSIASNYAPPTTSGFGNRTRISGDKRNSSPMSEGIMSAFDFGMSVVPSYMPNSPVIPQNNAIAMGMNQSPFGSGFSTIF